MQADHEATDDPNHDPPPHLSDRAAALWRDLVPRRAKTPGRVAMVQTALEALDRADAAREAVEVAGMTTTTKTTGAVHVHPLVKVERESRAQFTKVWGTLNLAFEFAGGDR